MQNRIGKCALVLAAALAATSQASEFVAPAFWTPGDAGTTYQQWDFFTASTGNLPDAGRLTDGTVLPNPTLDVVAPGFRTSGGNFYSFSGPYGFEATVPNYGTGVGTQVIVQVAASMNPDPDSGGPASVFIDSLHLEDDNGVTINGGTADAALQKALVASTPGTGPLGDIVLEWRMWEFYLPDYTGTVNIAADVIIHSSFNEVRVDTALASTAYPITPAPEPSTLLLVVAGLAALRRR